MKVLTLWQPWATLVAIGAKRIETRSWGTKHRGLLAIHAAMKRWDGRMIEKEPFNSALRRVFRFPVGAVIAVVRLTDCVQITNVTKLSFENQVPYGWEAAFGDYTLGRWMWHLQDVVGLPKPIQVRGHQGLWNWEPPAEMLTPEGLLPIIQGGSHDGSRVSREVRNGLQM